MSLRCYVWEFWEMILLMSSYVLLLVFAKIKFSIGMIGNPVDYADNLFGFDRIEIAVLI